MTSISILLLFHGKSNIASNRISRPHDIWANFPIIYIHETIQIVNLEGNKGVVGSWICHTERILIRREIDYLYNQRLLGS